MTNSKVFHILYIEDDEMDVDLMRSTLSSGTGEVEFRMENCLDGEMALRLVGQYLPTLERPVPDVILLDLHLPKVSGWSILNAIKSSPVLRSVPVIILSTSHVIEDRDKALQMGVTEYRVKPAGIEGYQIIFKAIKSICFTSPN